MTKIQEKIKKYAEYQVLYFFEKIQDPKEFERWEIEWKEFPKLAAECNENATFCYFRPERWESVNDRQLKQAVSLTQNL